MKISELNSFDYEGYSKNDIFKIVEHYQDELLSEMESNINHLEMLIKFKDENKKLRIENEKLKEELSKKNKFFEL